MKIFIMTLLLLSLNAQAASNKFILKTYNKDDLLIKEIDVNQDKKVDRIEKYKNDELVALELDTKFSGKMDQWIKYFKYTSDKSPVQIVEIDTNGDGKSDRIETSYTDHEHRLLIVRTEIDTKFKGTFDKVFNTQSPLDQKTEGDCPGDMPFDDLKVLKLTSDVSKVKMSMANGYYVTDWGYKIHQSCLETWGAESFERLLKSTMAKGFQCLARLAKDNKDKGLTPNGALNNLMGLEYLSSKNNISIICNEKNYDWKGTAGHASVTPGEVIKENGVTHPFISINPDGPKKKNRASAEESAELGSTLFHEQLHNLGIKHSESIEFPYACETCCVQEKVKDEEKANACKICSGGGYQGANDKNYLKDLIAWGKTSYQSERSSKSLVKFQKEFPNDRWGLFAYADASTGIFNPVGIELGKILKERFKDLTPEEEEHLQHVDYYANEAALINPKVSKASRLIAEAHVSRYYDGDTKKMMDELIKNKATFLEMIKTQKESKDNTQYILGDVKNKLKDLLIDVWFQDHPAKGNKESDRAYEYLRELGYLTNSPGK